MPRATFGGVTFDLLLRGMSNPLPARASIRYAGPTVWIQVVGPEVERLRGEALFDSYANYTTFKNLVGTSSSTGPLVYAEGTRTALLLSVDRNWRKGTGKQIAQVEFVFLS